MQLSQEATFSPRTKESLKIQDIGVQSAFQRDETLSKGLVESMTANRNRNPEITLAVQRERQKPVEIPRNWRPALLNVKIQLQHPHGLSDHHMGSSTVKRRPDLAALHQVSPLDTAITHQTSRLTTTSQANRKPTLMRHARRKQRPFHYRGVK